METNYTILVTDQTPYDTFIEYVIRFIPLGDSEFFEKRFQTDGTAAELNHQVANYVASLGTTITSEVITSTFITI